MIKRVINLGEYGRLLQQAKSWAEAQPILAEFINNVQRELDYAYSQSLSRNKQNAKFTTADTPAKTVSVDDGQITSVK
jgi:hypothetical protein